MEDNQQTARSVGLLIEKSIGKKININSRRKVDVQIRAIFFKLLNEVGFGAREIARMYGISHSTVIYQIKKANTMIEDNTNCLFTYNIYRNAKSKFKYNH